MALSQDGGTWFGVDAVHCMKRSTVFAVFLAVGAFLRAQVLSYTPAYPTIDDNITIVYDAGAGNAALVGVSPVFAHTGVINRFSTDSGDWEHQVSQWTSGYDSNIVMLPLGGGRHQITLKPRSFYGLSSSERARALAFVFRNETGTLAGKNADGSDIFVPLFGDTSFAATVVAPIERDPVLALGDVLPFRVQSNRPALITLFQDGVALGQSSGLVQDFGVMVNAVAYGKHRLHFTVDNGTTVLTDSIFYIAQAPTVSANLPAGVRDGINYVDDSTVVLCLLAPRKGYVYVIGDFNGWEMDPGYRMQKTPDGERFWLQLNGLTPGREYRFQYFVDHQIKIGDMYAEKVLDPWNDNGINSFVYPNLISYPSAYTSELVTVLQTAKPEYNWQVNNFQRPDNRDLIVYELLVRDFIQRHDYGTLIDSLSYLKKLGINAIEIMPVNEFDGNNSWGYGPAYYFAPDKYYGTENRLKEFIDACHGEGIAVIIDVVFNHCFGQAPHLRLYQDRGTGLPSGDNHYLNREATHPYSVGTDFNHESLYTQAFFDSVLSYWTEEYRADGFRFDLSKGFTQNVSGQDIGAWSAYDQSRINLLKRFANRYWQHHPGGQYLILEHFANNDEETELANFGFILWGKASTQYEQAAMGYESNSDFSFFISHQHRGWAFHNLLGFMESHDEERVMYKTLTYGNTDNASYNVRDTTVALKRMGLVAAFWSLVPGPKMMWQFGELGYDYSIEYDCRVCPKPIRWGYLQDPRRQYLMKTYAALFKLRTMNPNTFRSGSYDISAWGKQKQVHVNADVNLTLIGNFDVYNQDTWTGFQHTGRWYDYMTGDSIMVTDVNMTIPLAPGAWRAYTDRRQPVPDLSYESSVAVVPSVPVNTFALTCFPNPSASATSFSFDLPQASSLEFSVWNASGQLVARLAEGKHGAGRHELVWDGMDAEGRPVPSGFYLYRLQVGTERVGGRLAVQR